RDRHRAARADRLGAREPLRDLRALAAPLSRGGDPQYRARVRPAPSGGAAGAHRPARAPALRMAALGAGGRALLLVEQRRGDPSASAAPGPRHETMNATVRRPQPPAERPRNEADAPREGRRSKLAKPRRAALPPKPAAREPQAAALRVSTYN